MRKARTSCTLALLAPSTRQISETSSARPRNTSTYLRSKCSLRTLRYSRTSVPWGCSRWWGRERRCGPRPRGWPGPGQGCPWPPGTQRGSGAARTPGDTPRWSSLRLCLFWSLEPLLEPSSGQIVSPDHINNEYCHLRVGAGWQSLGMSGVWGGTGGQLLAPEGSDPPSLRVTRKRPPKWIRTLHPNTHSLNCHFVLSSSLLRRVCPLCPRCCHLSPSCEWLAAPWTTSGLRPRPGQEETDIRTRVRLSSSLIINGL